MDDVEFIFKQEIREKAKTGRGASCRASRKKGYKGSVKTAYDFMSRKERRALNGEVRCYNMDDIIISIDEFKNQTKERKKELLSHYLEIKTKKEIAAIWDCTSGNIDNWRKRLGMYEPKTSVKAISPIEAIQEASVKPIEILHVEKPRRAFSLHLEKEMLGAEIKDILLSYAGVLKDDETYDILLDLGGD